MINWCKNKTYCTWNMRCYSLLIQNALYIQLRNFSVQRQCILWYYFFMGLKNVPTTETLEKNYLLPVLQIWKWNTIKLWFFMLFSYLIYFIKRLSSAYRVMSTSLSFIENLYSIYSVIVKQGQLTVGNGVYGDRMMIVDDHNVIRCTISINHMWQTESGAQFWILHKYWLLV